jgi:hypothetical protein
VNIISHFLVFLIFKFYYSEKSSTSPKIEEGINLIYLEDQNKYLYIGGVKARDLEEKPIQGRKSDNSNLKKKKKE